MEQFPELDKENREDTKREEEEKGGDSNKICKLLLLQLNCERL